MTGTSVPSTRDELEPAPRSHALRGALARGCLRVSSRAPQRALEWLAHCAAPLAVRVPGRARNSLLLNLELCFPELDERERLALARRSVASGMTAMLELGALWNWERERVLALIREVRGGELIEEAVRSRRGAVLLTPHIGSWELGGLWASARYPMTSMYRPPRVRSMDDVYRKARERFGARLVPPDAGGLRALFRALQRGECVGVLPDQDPGQGAGIFVPFFGLSANTSTLAARLLGATDAVPILGWVERLGSGRFRLHLDQLESAVWKSGDVARAMAYLNGEIERLVRSCPEQYLWSYQRFRHQPDGRRNPYRHGREQVLRVSAGPAERGYGTLPD